MFVNNTFTIYDLFCSNPGNTLEQATAIIIFVDFNLILNFVFVQKVLSTNKQNLQSFSKI
jgi:hypothetical protein